MLGVPISEIFSTLQAQFGSSYINDFNLYGKVYRVIIQAEGRFRNQIEDINRLYVRSSSNEMVPLNTLVQVKPASRAALDQALQYLQKRIDHREPRARL